MNIYEWRKSKIIEMIFFGSVLDSLRRSEGGVVLFYKFSHCLISSRAKKNVYGKEEEEEEIKAAVIMYATKISSLALSF